MLDGPFPYITKRPVPARFLGWSWTIPRMLRVTSPSRAVIQGTRLLVRIGPAARRGARAAVFLVGRSGIVLVGDEIRCGRQTLATITGFRERTRAPSLILEATTHSDAAEEDLDGVEVLIVMPVRRRGRPSSPRARPAAPRRGSG